MKLFTLLVITLVHFSGFSQPWMDSLKVARKAYKNKEYDKATKYYKSAQNLAPKEVDLSEEIAQTTYRSRNFDDSEKVYQQAAASKSDKKEKAKMQHNIGNVRMKKKDYAGAIEAYKESLKNNPNDEETRYNLSEAIRQKKQQEQQNKDQQNKNDNKGEDNKDNQKNKNDSKQGNSKSDSNSKKEQNPSSSLPDRQADKMLDNLTRQESETKRRIARSQKGNSNSTKSGKNW
jgi:tetratricopeptide (TPR) repeat protein